MKVFWKIGDVFTEMIEVYPKEIEKARKRFPHASGIPHVYALLKDEKDVEWWPDCLLGEPSVRLDGTKPLSDDHWHPPIP